MAIQEKMKKKMEAEAASRQADVDVHLNTRSLDSKRAYSTQHLEDKTLSGKCCTNCVRPDNKIMLSKRDTQEFSSLYHLLQQQKKQAGQSIFFLCQYY